MHVLDPDPVFKFLWILIPEQKKSAERALKVIMTKDRQKMKKVTISCKNHLKIDGKFSRQRCLNPDLDPVFKKSMVPDLVYTSLEVGFGTGQY